VSYIVESGASSSRRSRRRRALITLGLVALMLFFAFWYAYSYYQSSSEPIAAPAPSCTTAAPTKGAAPKPGDITVNVYNATDRDGLAAKTATEMRARGFDVATVTNDPLQRTVVGPAEVRYGASGKAKAKVVLSLVKGAKPRGDGRSDGSVDLVIGDKFTGLVKVAKQAPATPAAPSSIPAC